MLGLVRRDLLIGIADAVAREDAPALFELAGRAVESGYDLRLVVRELARMTRDLLVLTIDPSRVSDPEIAADAERQALLDLSRRFSGEDLMRAFDVLTKAEYEIRSSMQPRYHLEMALLRWLHLRKLVPLTDLIEQMKAGATRRRRPAGRRPRAAGPPRPGARPWPPDLQVGPTAPCRRRRSRDRAGRRRRSRATPAAAEPASLPRRSREARDEGGDGGPNLKPVDASQLKDAFLGEIRKAKKFFYGTVVAQAQRIDLEGDKVVFVFGPQHRALRAQLEPEPSVARSRRDAARGPQDDRDRRRRGRWRARWPPSPAGAQRIVRRASLDEAAATAGEVGPAVGDRKQSLKERALSDTGVQTMLDVFAAEIKDVEEM